MRVPPSLLVIGSRSSGGKSQACDTVAPADGKAVAAKSVAAMGAACRDLGTEVEAVESSWGTTVSRYGNRGLKEVWVDSLDARHCSERRFGEHTDVGSCEDAALELRCLWQGMVILRGLTTKVA